MVGPGVGVEAGAWPRQFTEQPCVDEEPEVPVDGAQAHRWCSTDDQSVDFLGRGVRLDATDHIEHRATRNRQTESPVAQCDLSTLDARWTDIVRYPSSVHLRDDSHFHQVPGRRSRYERSPLVSRSTRSLTPYLMVVVEAGFESAKVALARQVRHKHLRGLV